jgi:hypothetical protein
LIFRHVKNAENSKIAANWNGSGTRDFSFARRNPGMANNATILVEMLQYLQELHIQETAMRSTNSMVISMRLPLESGKRLKRMANRHGWTPSDASARLVEEGLRRSEFAFIDFRDSPAGRQAYIQGSTLAVWEVMLLVRSYKTDTSAVARHLRWPEVRVHAAVNYAGAFPEEFKAVMAEYDSTDFGVLKRMLPQAADFFSRKASKN